ncbi:MAG: hypothetical protein CSA26_12300 [Desulfobacterales bacterium]|nr:MAG: hypothetical protein CSA26_12300 [Desulfobacterales bacterium]
MTLIINQVVTGEQINEAVFWFEKAAAQGDEDAQDALEQRFMIMSSQQVSLMLFGILCSFLKIRWLRIVLKTGNVCFEASQFLFSVKKTV